MVDDRVVQRKAREWARDTADEYDLSDAEWECLQDLLSSNEAFACLTTAQQAAVSIDEDLPRVDEEIHAQAREGAQHHGDALDQLIEALVDDAQEIVALAEAIDENATWGVMIDVYQAGYQSVSKLRAVDQQELIADAGIPPSYAARIKAEIGTAGGQEVA